MTQALQSTLVKQKMLFGCHQRANNLLDFLFNRRAYQSRQPTFKSYILHCQHFIHHRLSTLRTLLSSNVLFVPIFPQVAPFEMLDLLAGCSTPDLSLPNFLVQIPNLCNLTTLNILRHKNGVNGIFLLDCYTSFCLSILTLPQKLTTQIFLKHTLIFRTKSFS